MSTLPVAAQSAVAAPEMPDMTTIRADQDLCEAAGDAAHEDRGEIDEPLCDAAAVHEYAGGDEERQRKKRKRIRG